jgi:hypothetical protein
MKQKRDNNAQQSTLAALKALEACTLEQLAAYSKMTHAAAYERVKKLRECGLARRVNNQRPIRFMLTPEGMARESLPLAERRPIKPMGTLTDSKRDITYRYDFDKIIASGKKQPNSVLTWAGWR